MKSCGEKTVPKKDSHKKPYRRPELIVYGNIRNITQVIGNMGADDGGTGSMKRTGI